MLRSTVTPFGAALVLSLLLVAAACGGGSPAADAPQTTQVSVVTTSSIVADWVSIVGQDRVSVFSLLPPNADPHTFQPGARDVTRIADADLVLSVGLRLEGAWLKDLLANAATDASSIVELGEAVDPIEYAEAHAGEVALLEDVSRVVHEVEEKETSAAEGLEEIAALLAEGEEELPQLIMGTIGKVEAGELEADEAIEAIEELTSEGEEGHEGHGHGVLDPHFWFDPLRVKEAVNSIAERLSTLDPDGSQVYQNNAAAYNQELDTLHAWIEGEVAKLSEEQRKLVTSHDSFQYFADRYGFEVVGAIFPVNIEREPTAQELAELVEVIEREGVSAIFTEKSHSDRLGRRIAEETDAEVIGGLYTGSLGKPGGEAGTYLAMMRYNIKTIVEALL